RGRPLVLRAIAPIAHVRAVTSAASRRSPPRGAARPPSVRRVARAYPTPAAAPNTSPSNPPPIETGTPTIVGRLRRPSHWTADPTNAPPRVAPRTITIAR